MATKKAASTTKKTTTKKAPAKKPTSRATTAAKPAGFSGVGKHITSSLSSMGLWRMLVAEFIGTFILVSVIVAGQGQPIFVLFGIVAVVLMIGGISGAHVNPAITVGAWVTRRIGWLRAVGYILAQVLGATAAFFTLKAFLGGQPALTEEQISYGYTATELFSATAISSLGDVQWYLLAAEVLGTAILGFAVAYALRSKEILTSAFAVGTGIFAALMIGITVAGYAGGSSIINPAVAVALQAFDSTVWSYAIYALGPVIGGVIGFGLFDFLYKGQK